MTAAHLPASPTQKVSANGDGDATRQELARVIESRLAQGYRVESVDETRAILVCKGRKRMFGLRGGLDRRSELTIGDHGRVTTRNI